VHCCQSEFGFEIKSAAPLQQVSKRRVELCSSLVVRFERRKKFKRKRSSSEPSIREGASGCTTTVDEN
jgi:hypothetical protein